MTLHFRSFVTNNYYRLQMTKMDYNFLEIYYLNFFQKVIFSFRNIPEAQGTS